MTQTLKRLYHHYSISLFPSLLVKKIVHGCFVLYVQNVSRKKMKMTNKYTVCSIEQISAVNYSSSPCVFLNSWISAHHVKTSFTL